MERLPRPFVIRPAQPHDLSGIMELLRYRGSGLTSLPDEPTIIARKLHASWDFLTNHTPSQTLTTVNLPAKLLFVLADPQGDTIAGITGVAPRIGLKRPTWHFALTDIERDAPSLEITHVRRCLQRTDACTGCSEVGSLLLHPEWRGGGYGSLLTGCRYLFIADHRDLFANTTLAQMRGMSDRHGHSPFWEAVGQSFFPLTFSEADRLSGVGRDDWVPELMPIHPLYVDLLPESARAVIGHVHPQTEPALNLLKAEGFRYTPYLDLFDGGPVLACATDDIHSVAHADVSTVHISDSVGGGERAPIAHGHGSEFRCARVPVDRHQHEIIIDQRSAALLNAQEGARVRIAPRRQKRAAA